MKIISVLAGNNFLKTHWRTAPPEAAKLIGKVRGKTTPVLDSLMKTVCLAEVPDPRKKVSGKAKGKIAPVPTRSMVIVNPKIKAKSMKS